jgi:RNA polymerase sigma-B factor
MSATIHHLPTRGPDDTRLVRDRRNGDPHARETMIRRYLPFARSLAARYRHPFEPLDDLEQVAALGLIKAVDRWDPTRGIPFRVFATPTILGELRRYFRDATWAVRPPRPLQELSLEVERAREPLHLATGREPRVADLARRLGRTAADVDEALRAAGGRWTRPLDAPLDGEDVTLGDTIGRDEPGYARAEARAVIERLSVGLDSRTRLILRLRFDEDLTQAEIAERVGLSQMYVSRLIRRAVDRLSTIATDARRAA